MALEIAYDFDSSFRSRSVLEESDDEIEYQEIPTIFRWGKIAKENIERRNISVLEPEILLIGMQGTGAAFLSALCMEHAVLIGLLVLPEISLKGSTLDPMKGNNTCRIYSIDGEDCRKIAVISNIAVPRERSWNWTQSLFQKLSPKRVYLLDSLISSNYIAGDNQSSSLRLIATTNAKKEKKNLICPFLEPPNIIDNATAAVISHCEVEDIEACLYLSLQSRDDIGFASSFEGLLPLWGLENSIETIQKNFSQVMQFSKPSFPSRNLFYV